jgi:hypothetical protein
VLGNFISLPESKSARSIALATIESLRIAKLCLVFLFVATFEVENTFLRSIEIFDASGSTEPRIDPSRIPKFLNLTMKDASDSVGRVVETARDIFQSLV